MSLWAQRTLKMTAIPATPSSPHTHTPSPSYPGSFQGSEDFPEDSVTPPADGRKGQQSRRAVGWNSGALAHLLLWLLESNEEGTGGAGRF